MIKQYFVSYCKENGKWDAWKNVNSAEKGAKDSDYTENLIRGFSTMPIIFKGFLKKKIIVVTLGNEEV